MNEKRIKKEVVKLKRNLSVEEELLETPRLSKRRREKMENKRDRFIEEINKYNEMMNDPDYAEKVYREAVKNSPWTKAAEVTDNVGKSMQSTGKKITKVGMHTTGAVWSPLIYAGYQGVKHARKKPKNETPEQDLIELIKEVEAAHKDGKINEEQKREYVLDFVDNYYRK